LIKIKLGITYFSISSLFNSSRQTTTRIFYKIFNTLAIKTLLFIFRPSKHTVRETLPEAYFKKNHKNRRCAMDCTEIKTEKPNSVEQRVYNVF